MKNPVYLVKKEQPTVDTTTVRVGDRVRFTDGSGTLSCSKDGLENIHPAFEHRTGGVKKGVVVAMDCVLPTEPFITTRNFINDTIVVTDDNLTIFCYNKFLRRI